MKSGALELLAGGIHLVSPAACAEYLTREKQMGHGRWIRAPHLDLLSEALVDLAVEPNGRLMVIWPPRHGKSEEGSHWFPTWHKVLWPERRIIHATHTFEFAREWGMKVRDSLNEYWPELGVALKEDSNAAHRWETREGGGMLCVGVRGSVVGRGGNILILDDPTKDSQEAQSEVVQARNWEWWKGTFRTRLEPGGSILVIGTRWSEGDLLGKLIAAHKAGPGTEGYEPWKILWLPAIAEEGDLLGRPKGEALWPERFDAEALANIRTSVGEYNWAAQYRGHPVPLGGGLLKHAWWRYWVPRGQLGRFAPVVVDGITCPVVELPEKLDTEIQSWDANFRDSVRPILQGKEPDAVAGHVWGRKGADLFLLDRYHARVGLAETEHAVREMSQAHPTARVKLIEFTANGPAVMARLQHEVGGFVAVTPVGSKVARVIGAARTEPDRHGRAVSMAAAAQAGNFYLPHPALKPWVREFRELLGRFPADGRDDTDATSQAWAHLQGPAWMEMEKAHREALVKDRTPADTVELFKRQMLEAARAKARKPKRAVGHWPGRNW